MGEWMNGYLERLRAGRAEDLAAGGPERVAVQHGLGKLTARERIERLADPGSFVELGARVRDVDPFRKPPDGDRPSPGDGVVMGLARIDGRQVMVWALDFTVLSGSLGNQGVWKIAELVEMAGRERVPIIGMIDSAGSRIGIDWGKVGLCGLGRLIRNYCLYSGIIPRITLLLGPCTGPLAQLPALSDFLIADRKAGFLWLGGEIESEGAGSAEFHMSSSGQCDLVASGDEEAIDLTRRLLRFLPQSCWQEPPAVAAADDPLRRSEELLEVMPDDPRFTYDMHEVIELIADDGELLELKQDFAPNLIVGFARFGGVPVGVVASNPDELSGIMEPDSSDKYDKFMMFLDAFSIPILNISDTTAYPPGDKWERMGVIRHGAKNLHGYTHMTNRKVTVVLRRSYGGSNITMGCSKMGPDFIFGWPTVEFAPTGPESIVQAIFHKELAKAKEEGSYEALYGSLLGAVREQFSVMNLSRFFTTYYTVHEVIDPRETREHIISALAASAAKAEELPAKRRWVKPA